MLSRQVQQIIVSLNRNSRLCLQECSLNFLIHSTIVSRRKLKHKIKCMSQLTWSRRVFLETYNDLCVLCASWSVFNNSLMFTQRWKLKLVISQHHRQWKIVTCNWVVLLFIIIWVTSYLLFIDCINIYFSRSLNNLFVFYYLSSQRLIIVSSHTLLNLIINNMYQCYTLYKMCDHRQYDYNCEHKVTEEIVRCSNVVNRTDCTEIRTLYFDAANENCSACNYSTSSSFWCRTKIRNEIVCDFLTTTQIEELKSLFIKAIRWCSDEDDSIILLY